MVPVGSLGAEFFEFVNPVQKVHPIVPFSLECDPGDPTTQTGGLVEEEFFESGHHNDSGDEPIVSGGGGEGGDDPLPELRVNDVLLYLAIHSFDDHLNHDVPVHLSFLLLHHHGQFLLAFMEDKERS